MVKVGREKPWLHLFWDGESDRLSRESMDIARAGQWVLAADDRGGRGRGSRKVRFGWLEQV